MSLPAGEPTDPLSRTLHMPVHAIDGDGASLCQLIGPGLLSQIDHYAMADIPEGRQCHECRTVMIAYGVPGL